MGEAVNDRLSPIIALLFLAERLPDCLWKVVCLLTS